MYLTADRKRQKQKFDNNSIKPKHVYLQRVPELSLQ